MFLIICFVQYNYYYLFFVLRLRDSVVVVVVVGVTVNFVVVEYISDLLLSLFLS